MTRIDADGRFRSSYAPYADTGRLRSSGHPLDGGSNAQNIDREARDQFIPDEGCVFLGVDLSLAEDRDVKVRTKSARLIKMARLPPWEIDFHRLAAATIFRCDPLAVTKDQRYIGKRTKHASNYDMHGQRLSDELLREGYTFTPEECDSMIVAVREPEVVDWQRRIRQSILRHRRLTNSWGRTINYEHERMDDELYRRAYAYLPQSDIGDLMSVWGLIVAHRYIATLTYSSAKAPRVRINQDGHDSLLISAPPWYVWPLVGALRTSLERSRDYDGVPLSIPCEFSLGASWTMEHEFKRLPSQREFVDVAYSVYDGLYGSRR